MVSRSMRMTLKSVRTSFSEGTAFLAAHRCWLSSSIISFRQRHYFRHLEVGNARRGECLPRKRMEVNCWNDLPRLYFDHSGKLPGSSAQCCQMPDYSGA